MAAAACAACAPKEPPVSLIFDTDMGNDVDDPLALDMLYKAVDRGEIILLGILSSKDTEFSPRYIDMMNTWYGYPEIPVGRVRDGVVLKRDDYARAVCESGLFPRSRRDRDYGDPVTLYRRLLAESPDSSVVVVSVGFSTNLGRLLESWGDKYSPLDGIELVKRKVKFCSVMGGSFGDKPRAEYNIVNDIPNAKRLFALCTRGGRVARTGQDGELSRSQYRNRFCVGRKAPDGRGLQSLPQDALRPSYMGHDVGAVCPASRNVRGVRTGNHLRGRSGIHLFHADAARKAYGAHPDARTAGCRAAILRAGALFEACEVQIDTPAVWETAPWGRGLLTK